MAKEMVTLAFIFAILLSVLSPTIEVIKAEIVEKRDLMPLSDGETILPNNGAPYRRYGPFIEQLIFSSRDALVKDDWPVCPKEVYVESCDDCNDYCSKFLPCRYGQCEGLWPVRDCYCYCRCK